MPIFISVMFWRQMDPRGRAVATIVALLLFVSGSNFCVLSALGGGSMACLSVPGAASAGAVSHCCSHSRAPEGRSRSNVPAGTGTSSCCVNLAMAHGPEIHKAEVDSSPAPSLNAAATLQGPSTAARFVRTPEQHPPPLSDLATRHPGRAPPLS